MTDILSPSTMDAPRLLFATQHEMDDYCAPDMLYGDLSAEVLRRQYHLRDISTRLNPFTHPNHEESARILFDEFRYLSDTFSFWGPYKSLARTMITHMQDGNGTVFSDPLLDQAMSEHSSMKRNLELMTTIFTKSYVISKAGTVGFSFEKVTQLITQTRLPKFDSFQDRFNGLGITVHDTWATHIYLESISFKNNHYVARLRFHFQDHFGLDTTDVSNTLYRNFRIFRIWFILQRWENYGFRPFITEINSVAEFEGILKK
ncbi:DUF3289 family protein [Mixta calida]|mgnify:FL=1|uniref:DUF3289 family protein n=2 Tax=Mixta calida TaxID=665913 RepID=UPI002FDDC184